MNMIQDMIDFGFEFRPHENEDVRKFDMTKPIHVSIYESIDEGWRFKLVSYCGGEVLIISFRNTVDPNMYGYDYRPLNKDEIDTLDRLLEVLKL